MKRLATILALITTITMSSCRQNPLLSEFEGPYGTAPFDKIELADYKPAFIEGILKHQEEVDAIVNNPDAPTFENTIEAYEASGLLLNRVSNIFFNLLSADGDEAMMNLSQELMPMLTDHTNNLTLNEKLFERIKIVYEGKDSLDLTQEQLTLLEDTYKSMVRNGANLQGEEKEKYRQLTSKLDSLSLTFGQNQLKASNAFEMILTTEEELAGLPESVREAAKMLAEAKGKEGYLFNVSYPSFYPFMKYSANRELREKMYRAYNSIALGGEFDNSQNVLEQVAARKELANLLGYKDWATYVLDNRMAKTPEAVYELLDNLLEAYTPAAKKEVEVIKTYAENKEGKKVDLMPWDWSYYSDAYKTENYDLNDEMLKPYFDLEKVKKGVFGLATTLYGLQFEKRNDIAIYNEEVEVYKVTDAEGKYMGILYTDFFPRETKQQGAWKTDFKKQWVEKDGTDSRPHILLVMNFTKPTKDKPALLTFSEVGTFLHEFGHSLHGMLTKCNYASVSGTSVYRDFVELPSQIMENWLNEKEFLDTFAEHYQTGEKIPAELIEKVEATSQFNAAYACLRQLSLGYLDMGWHTLQGEIPTDMLKQEVASMAKSTLLPVPDSTNMSTHFGHIFDGGYAAGYYGYKWSEVLDADAFAVFKENGIFDKNTADAFRTNILEKGGTEEPMKLYKDFKGSEPSIEAIMRRDGIIK
ncbi:MAG: M3 family metallopeptidase [Bacteroidales bacterium]|nr:M3 family metallopeptidase [Bacteroidales bacterium]